MQCSGKSKMKPRMLRYLTLLSFCHLPLQVLRSLLTFVSYIPASRKDRYLPQLQLRIPDLRLGVYYLPSRLPHRMHRTQIRQMHLSLYPAGYCIPHLSPLRIQALQMTAPAAFTILPQDPVLLFFSFCHFCFSFLLIPAAPLTTLTF